ncbi:MAG: hypothetical protein MZV70_16620 [Desulfobacterales bacterium]|nr:hypothetical protein [Desulfobacterales bacterium]
MICAPRQPHYLDRAKRTSGSPRVGMELGGSKGSARTGVGGGTMKISPEKLAAEAEATGFRPDVLEKVAPPAWAARCHAKPPFPQREVGPQGRNGLESFRLRCSPALRGHRPELRGSRRS